MRNKYFPRSRPDNFDQLLSKAFRAAFTAASTSAAVPSAIRLKTSSVAGLIELKCDEPLTHLPLMKWPYSGSILTTERDSGAAAYSKFI